MSICKVGAILYLQNVFEPHMSTCAWSAPQAITLLEASPPILGLKARRVKRLKKEKRGGQGGYQGYPMVTEEEQNETYNRFLCACDAQCHSGMVGLGL